MPAKKIPVRKKKYQNNEPATQVHEPAVELLKIKRVKNKLFATDKYSALAAVRKPANHMTPMEKFEAVKNGVTKDDLELLKENAGLDYDTLAQGLSTSRATLINIKGKDKFNVAVSEKIIGLDDIYSYGYEVFGNKETFNQWMFRPNKALASHAPFDLVNNEFGREEVKNLIGRIDYGVYA
jgi:putative toxin-antitoxin system antitoxin component (TIGR02293 family)